MIRFLYQRALKPILFKFSPDFVHDVFVLIGKKCHLWPMKTLIQLFYGRSKAKYINVDGISYRGPVILAAGFDYNAHLSHSLDAVGFAGEEIGSVTAKPCKGNNPPNLKRLIKSKSIQVYKGLKNDGVDTIIQRLAKQTRPNDFVMGISIAKTNNEDCSVLENAIDDYLYSFKRLNETNTGDYYTLNISCPNAFGGETFTRADYLEKLLEKVKSVDCSKPIYIKMPINLDWNEFTGLLDIIVKYKIHGVIIGNLNKKYDEIDYPNEVDQNNYRGGLSGKPCQKRSTDLIRRTRQYCPDLTIIGCGGVITKEDALEKLDAGADLIQLISGMIFNGPHLINDINNQLR
ncbi:MAG: dihydroorotate dehydrogenase (quinone) [Bacteriovoracaceae bacterium]|jgi:dihydroorotate dehydrogenase subfamily 2|nr:dihydroorotate dehydrogenase (quinone) [Bacteriovoracaceae bacterium]